MITVIFKMTKEQGQAFSDLLKDTHEEDRSKLIRRLIKDECNRRNITFLDNMPAPSRKRKTE